MPRRKHPSALADRLGAKNRKVHVGGISHGTSCFDITYGIKIKWLNNLREASTRLLEKLLRRCEASARGDEEISNSTVSSSPTGGVAGESPRPAKQVGEEKCTSANTGRSLLVGHCPPGLGQMSRGATPAWLSLIGALARSIIV